MVGEPWPMVPECYHRLATPTHSCEQCNPTHVHAWRRYELTNGWATRCEVCGARKCDDSKCNQRRHHEGDHIWRMHRVAPQDQNYLRGPAGPRLMCAAGPRDLDEDGRNGRSHGIATVWALVTCADCLALNPGPVPDGDVDALEAWLA